MGSTSGSGEFSDAGRQRGADTEEDFSSVMFKRPKIVSVPKLRYIINNAKFEKQVVKTITVEEKCDKEHVYNP